MFWGNVIKVSNAQKCRKATVQMLWVSLVWNWIQSYPYSPTLNILPILLTPKKYTRVSCLTMVIAKLTYFFKINWTVVFNFLQFILLLDFPPYVFSGRFRSKYQTLAKEGENYDEYNSPHMSTTNYAFVLSVKKERGKEDKNPGPSNLTLYATDSWTRCAKEKPQGNAFSGQWALIDFKRSDVFAVKKSFLKAEISKLWPQAKFILPPIFVRNPTMCPHWHTICGCLHTTTTEMSGCDGECAACKA